MYSRVSQREVCVKHGLILTCFVNGKKRFKAVSLTALAAAEPHRARQPGPSAVTDVRRRLR
ncbi:MAG: hypothetical protein HZA51_13965 [Planctomycetes bacterium]|nr:hypothetical protein [Planctomycetota bacterium]